MDGRLFALVIVAWGWFSGTSGAAPDEHSGAHECALLSQDFHPCTVRARPDGGYIVSQPGNESFEGTLEPRGSAFHLEGTYRFPSAPEAHLEGDVNLAGATFEGRVKAGKIPVTIAIRPAKPAKAVAKPSALADTMAKLVDRESVVAGSRLPLAVKYPDDPKLSYSLKAIDDSSWEKIRGVFGMVPAGNNIGIDCRTSKLECTLTAQSSAQVAFYFTKTKQGLKLIRVEMPSTGD